MKPRYDNVLETIGNTPVIRINRLAPPGVNLYVKAESFNPMHSVKDRMALGVIETAERSGALKPGQTVVEATSGNTGIGLAMVCAIKGYPLVVTMAESFSVERRKILRFLGARVVLTPAAQKGTGMAAKARELAEAHGWFLVSQFDNEANADAHVRTTAEEILASFDDIGLDAFVTGYGTGGTLKGIASVLRRRSPATRVTVCEPDNSALFGSSEKQPRDDDGQPNASHPAFRPHPIQGWTPDFIPRLAEDARDLVDELLPVTGEAALQCSRELARREGLFVGISAGATFAAALEVARRAPRGSNVLCMLPDTGERYLSTPLFADIGVDMNDDELAISRSTPNCRFDADVPPIAVATTTGEPAMDAETEAFLDGIVNDPERPVVLFALQWCEFCWAVRNLFGASGVPYRSVDLDSAEFREDGLAGRVRASLHRRTGAATIPQVFIGGAHVGGCSELFDAYEDGRLANRLKAAGMAIKPGATAEPAKLLPGWVHPRFRKSA